LSVTIEELFSRAKEIMEKIPDMELYYHLRDYGVALRIYSRTFKTLKGIIALRLIGFTFVTVDMIIYLMSGDFPSGGFKYFWQIFHLLGDHHVLIKKRKTKGRSTWILHPSFTEKLWKRIGLEPTRLSPM